MKSELAAPTSESIPFRIVHVGPEDVGTTWQRVRAFKDLGVEVHRVFYSLMSERPKLLLRIYRALRRRVGFPVEQCDENRELIRTVSRVNPDLVFIEKGLSIRPQTLIRLRNNYPKLVIFCYSLDDMMNPANQSRYYIKCIPIYDAHFTTKFYNVSELMDLGAKRVERTRNAYSPHVHRPVGVSVEDIKEFGADVSFVGDYEEARGAILNELARAGIKVRVWGSNWQKFRNPHPGLRLEMRPAFGEDYGKVVCSSKILLGFLNKANRDVETTRTVEIPAFGAFLLAERTEAQQRLFAEGTHAEYFGDTVELIEKITYYLAEDAAREKIAAAGLKHCRNSGYSYEVEMQKIIEEALGIETNWDNEV